MLELHNTIIFFEYSIFRKFSTHFDQYELTCFLVFGQVDQETDSETDEGHDDQWLEVL